MKFNFFLTLSSLLLKGPPGEQGPRGDRGPKGEKVSQLTFLTFFLPDLRGKVMNKA